MRTNLQRAGIYWSMFFLIVIAATLVQADDGPTLEEIQRAIVEKGASWQAGESSVFRLSPEERRRLCGAQKVVPDPSRINPAPQFFRQAASLTRFDWRDYNGHNWTTPVRDQKTCGSCVAFGCMSAFEAAISVYFNVPDPSFDLSEQHIFSCGGGSCDGGWNVPACLDYIMTQGAPDEECYPYRAMDDQPPNYGAPCEETCEDWQMRTQKLFQWGIVPGKSEEEIKNAVMNSPVASYMTVYSDFYGYSSGVYEHVTGGVEGGHIIAIVGWDDEQNCWICKNSWGSTWAEESGWFYIRKGTNEAEIESYVTWMVPLPAEYPSLSFVAYDVVDSLGDGDGVLNPGETARLKVAVENQRIWATASGVTGILSSADPGIIIHDLLADYQEDIEPGQIVWNETNEFTFTVGEDVGVCQIPLSVDISATCARMPFYYTILDFDLAVTYDQYGWPLDLSSVRSSPLLVDMDADGDREVVVVDNVGTLHMLNKLGEEEPGFPVSVEGDVCGSVAVGDINGDGHLDVVFGSKNDTVYAFTNSGARLFARGVGSPVYSTPALADLDSDGHLETVVGTMNGSLYALQDDGTDHGPFPISLGTAVLAGSAVAYIDSDDVLDIVVGSLNRNVYAISADSGYVLCGFPVSTGGMVVSAPSVADIDEDGYNEIAIGCDDGNFYLISHLGEIQFTVSSGQMIRCSPAIGDLDVDGHLDVIFTSKSGQVYAVDNAGNVLSGWPFQAGSFIESSPAIVDMDGDGLPEVIIGTSAEKLHILAWDGSVVQEYPTPSTGAIFSSAAVGHLDQDDDLEIILGTPSGLSVWDYKLAGGTQMPWPMYRGNCRRTGYFGDNAATSVSGPSEGLALPLQFALQQNYPNPFNAGTQVRFCLPEDCRLTLEVFNILGQRVVTMARGFHKAGMHQVMRDGKDEGGSLVASGIYFCRLRAGQFSGTKRMVLLR